MMRALLLPVSTLSLSHSEIDSYCRHHLTEWEKRGLGITHAQNPSKKELLFLASARVTMCVCVSTKRQHHAGRCDDDDEDAEKEEGGSHPKKMSFPPARCTHTGLLPRISSCCRFPSSSSSISNSTVRHLRPLRTRVYDACLMAAVLEEEEEEAMGRMRERERAEVRKGRK